MMFFCLAGSFFSNICRIKPVTDRWMQIPVTTRTSSSFVKTEFKIFRIPSIRILALFPDKDIPCPPHGLNERGVFRIIAQFVAQAAHRNVHRTIECIPVYSSQLIEYLVAVQYLSTVSDQQCQCG